jgi:hypothetical protein
MTLKRRLDAIEPSLSPTQLVLRWLAEAHAYGSLEAYVGSLLDLPGDQQPIDRLCREAHEGVQARLRGKPAEQIRQAVNSALRETVFRFELVLRIYVTAHELLDREQLLDALFAAQLALLASEDQSGRADATYGGRFATVMRLVSRQVGELAAAQQAREIVEARYLDGHAALFPDVAAAWEVQVRSTEGIADMAVRQAELDGVPAATPPDPDALSDLTAELVADLIEPAKSTALEKLGEGERALGIASAWVRTRIVSKAVDVGEPAAGKNG